VNRIVASYLDEDKVEFRKSFEFNKKMSCKDMSFKIPMVLDK